MSETPNSNAHPWAMYRTGHLFQWGSNDPSPPETPETPDTPDTLETPETPETEVSTDPAASAWFTGKARTPK